MVIRLETNPTNILLLKVNNKNTRKRCEICLELTLKTPEARFWNRSSSFIVDFEQVKSCWEMSFTLTGLLRRVRLSGAMPTARFGIFSVLATYQSRKVKFREEFVLKSDPFDVIRFCNWLCAKSEQLSSVKDEKCASSFLAVSFWGFSICLFL